MRCMRYSLHCSIWIAVWASLLGLLILGGCPGGAKKPGGTPKARAVPSAEQGEEAGAKAPSQPTAPRAASVLFLPPPVSAEHPERAILNEQFRQGAEQTFASAGWQFCELELAELSVSSWRSAVLASVEDSPVVIFTYQEDFLDFLRGLVGDSPMERAMVVIALAEPEENVPPQFLQLEFHPEELGFVGGIMAAELTTDGHVALYAFSEDYYSDLFVAGFWQGLMVGRSGASLRDLRVSRREMTDREEGASLMAELLNKVNSEYDPRFAVDVVAFWTGPLGDAFAGEVAAARIPVIAGVVPSQDATPFAPVTSLYYDFSAIPQFLVDNQERLGLLKRYDLDGSPAQNRGHKQGDAGTPAQPDSSTAGSRRVHIRMDSGLMKVQGFDNYLRFHSLPAEFMKSVDFYVRSLQVGELEVKPELPESP